MRELGGDLYYDVIAKGGIMMDVRGKEVMEYMHGVVSNLYRNCFIKFKYKNSCLVGDVFNDVHSWYRNPPHATFSDVWGRIRIRKVLSNRRPHLKKLTHDEDRKSVV